MTIVEEYRRNSSRVLDRLVDGELGPQQRRELLANFDDEPGAWRSCALAFLEAQSWRLQMARVASEPILEQVKKPTRTASGATDGAWGSWLALAACVAVAFAIGTRYPSGARNASPTVASDRSADAPTLATAPAELGSQSEGSPYEAPLRSLTLTPVGSESRDAIELPVLESNSIRARAAAAETGPLSGSLVQQFEKDGFQVDRQQRLWPVDLPDGRRVLVPIEEVDIRTPSVEHL